MKNNKPKNPGKKSEPPPRPEEIEVERALEASINELHMGQYPIFCITTSKPTDTRMTYREKVKMAGVEILKEWIVQVTSYYGWPGEHEAEVWRALQHIMELRGRAGCLENPIETTLEEIRDHMSSKSKGGRQRQAIVRSLYCLANTRLDNNYWYDAAKEIYDHVSFNMVSDLKFSQKKLPSGKEIIKKVYFGFGPEVFRNIQSRYIRPVDKGFLDTRLDSWLAKRLYEVLGPKFYGLRKKGVPYRTRYTRLCALLGTKQQNYPSIAKRILGRAHEELQLHGFIAKVEWFPTLKEKSDWVLHYWPGSRAKAEWKKEFWWKRVDLREALYIEELPPTAPEPIYVEEPPDESVISAQMITDQAAEELPKQLPIFVEEPPDFAEISKPPKAKPSPAKAKAVITVPAEVIPPSKPALAPPAPPEPEEDSYAKDAIWAFESASGKHRKLSKLTAAEQKRLAEWKTQGITPPDIESGTKAAIAKALEQARASGKPPREIVSLAYVNGYVLDAALKRQDMERLVQSSLSKARAFQSQELRELEAQIKGKLQGKPGVKGFYQDFIEPLILVNAQGGFAVLVSPIQDCAAFFLKQDWLKPIVEAVGFPAYVTWVVEWAYGYEWRSKLGQV